MPPCTVTLKDWIGIATVESTLSLRARMGLLLSGVQHKPERSDPARPVLPFLCRHDALQILGSCRLYEIFPADSCVGQSETKTKKAVRTDPEWKSQHLTGRSRQPLTGPGSDLTALLCWFSTSNGSTVHGGKNPCQVLGSIRLSTRQAGKPENYLRRHPRLLA